MGFWDGFLKVVENIPVVGTVTLATESAVLGIQGKGHEALGKLGEAGVGLAGDALGLVTGGAGKAAMVAGKLGTQTALTLAETGAKGALKKGSTEAIRAAETQAAKAAAEKAAREAAAAEARAAEKALAKKAEEEAIRKAEREATERAAKKEAERVEREAKEAAHKRAEREAAARKAKEEAEKRAKERARREKIEREKEQKKLREDIKKFKERKPKYEKVDFDNPMTDIALSMLPSGSQDGAQPSSSSIVTAPRVTVTPKLAVPEMPISSGVGFRTVLLGGAAVLFLMNTTN